MPSSRPGCRYPDGSGCPIHTYEGDYEHGYCSALDDCHDHTDCHRNG